MRVIDFLSLALLREKFKNALEISGTLVSQECGHPDLNKNGYHGSDTICILTTAEQCFISQTCVLARGKQFMWTISRIIWRSP